MEKCFIPVQMLCIFEHTVQITFIFIDFRVCDFAFAFKTQNAPCVLNAFYFQTDFNLRIKRKRDVRLTCKRVWCILHHTLSIQWLCPVTSHIIAQTDLTSGFGNPPNAHRSQIKICEKRQTRHVQFRFMPNAFRILKPIRNAFECFVTQVQTHLPKTKRVWPMKIMNWLMQQQRLHWMKHSQSWHYLTLILSLWWRDSSEVNGLISGLPRLITNFIQCSPH